MKIQDILKATSHRDEVLPKTNWKFYQEWNRALFLHFKVEMDELRAFVPKDLEIDLFEGCA